MIQAQTLWHPEKKKMTSLQSLMSSNTEAAQCYLVSSHITHRPELKIAWPSAQREWHLVMLSGFPLCPSISQGGRLSERAARKCGLCFWVILEAGMAFGNPCQPSWLPSPLHPPPLLPDGSCHCPQLKAPLGHGLARAISPSCPVWSQGRIKDNSPSEGPLLPWQEVGTLPQWSGGVRPRAPVLRLFISHPNPAGA